MSRVMQVGVDVGSVLRALRRQADLSQRELATRAKVPKSTVARIESDRGANPCFRTVARLVEAAGGALDITTLPKPARPDAASPDAASSDGLRDAAGRRYPAHLDPQEVRDLRDWPGAWWASWQALPESQWPLRPPDHTYDLDRAGRDRRRLREWVRQVTRVRQVTDGLPEGCWRLVAELPDGRPVGELRAHERSVDLLVGRDLGDERDLVLDGVLVTPQARLLGIGRRLVAALVARLDRVGIERVTAVAEFDTGFLTACGFRPEAVRPVSFSLTPALTAAAGR